MSSSTTTSFSCGVCQVSFESNPLQRAHAKTDWHVYNLKRRMASLPSLTLDVYLENIAGPKQGALISPPSVGNSDSAANPVLILSIDEIKHSSGEDDTFIPSRCLFCSKTSRDLDDNLGHMRTVHGLFIPHQDSLIDLETFVKYLFTIITEFGECLHCGKVKDSTDAVLQHMLSIGHCSLNPDAGSEYEDFYESSSDESDSKGKGLARILDDELQLPSGKTIGHRSQARVRESRQLDSKPNQKAIDTTSSRGSGVKDRQVASRNANMGLIGVLPSQRRALGVLEKKMLKREVRAQNQYRAVVEKAGNKQKYFKPDVPGPKNG